MRKSMSGLGSAWALPLCLALAVQVLPAAPAPLTYKTNLVQHTLTNVVEITMPVNRFVNVYRTNYFDSFSTNHVDVYLTNRVVQNVTNTHVIDLVRTNLAQVTLTNIKTLNLTNWATVLVFKTNWITQPVTNVVEVELQSPPPTAKRATTTAVSVPSTSPAASMANENLKVEARKTGRRLANKHVEVEMSVKPARLTLGSVQVQQWRVESVDGSFLCCAQEQEFKRDLPTGNYKIEVRTQATADGALLAAKGTLAVTSEDVTLQIRSLPKL